MQAALTDLGETLTGDIDVFPVIQPMMLTVGKAFNQFIETECKSDDTFRFWYRFVFEDCFLYIALHTAIRCQNWKLRLSALKTMAPIFTAFDRTTYKQLFPHHLADVQTFPISVLQSLQGEAFTVNILGRKGHAVALDEAHEMCINKDMKYAVVRPSKEYLQKTSLFLRLRIAAYKNLLSQLLPAAPNALDNYGIYSDKPELNRAEQNIKSMMDTIEDRKLFQTSPHSNRGLINVFTGRKATLEQAHDLLHFRNIGIERFHQYIKFHILKHPSSNAPKRKQRLLTMAAPKSESKKRFGQRERDETSEQVLTPATGMV